MAELSKDNGVPDWGWIIYQGNITHIVSATELYYRFGQMTKSQTTAIREELRERLIRKLSERIVL